MKHAIALENIQYAYARSPVLQDITFSVSPGDFFIIIGPNGSGKTTLMKLIAGIAQPGAGMVKILDNPIHSYSRRTLARKIAFVPQSVPIDFPFTVKEVVLMGRSPYQGMLGLENRDDIEKMRQAITFTGMTHLADRKMSQLSGGECQRAFIARAICQEPSVLLLDEPTASLDLSHQIRIMDLMEKLKAEKQITIVMVSHDVNLAAMYGNRLLLLDKGCIAEIGPPSEVLTYQNLEKSYGCTLLVDKNPLGDVPRVTLVPGKFVPK
ncbi:MAG: ABC transporter ATP-binding protein [Desulfobacterales bacterium]|nr:ABC transporter ATP-binding protein [Desulfobacterales bacterium]MDX2511828.1 ABC transporter ATP-binding protein [Desulfobacterales bacterium]